MRRTDWNISLFRLFKPQVNRGNLTMGAGYFIMAIMGCGDGSAACTPVAAMPTHYATEDQCVAATGEALLNSTGIDYPTIVARCRSVKATASVSRKPGKTAPVLALRD